MNIKRLFLSFPALFIFIFFFEWGFHGVLLKDVYAQSPGVWRSPNELLGHFHWLVLGQAIMAFMFAVLFASGFAGAGVGGGIRLGIMLAVFSAGVNFIFYAMQPLPAKLIAFWNLGGLIECVAAGALVGVIYKPIAHAGRGAPQK